LFEGFLCKAGSVGVGGVIVHVKWEMLECSFFQFLTHTKRLSLVPPPEEKFGRLDSGDRPIDKDWLKGFTANFLDEGIRIFIPRHENRPNLHGEYVEISFKFTDPIPYFENGCARMRGVGGGTK